MKRISHILQPIRDINYHKMYLNNCIANYIYLKKLTFRLYKISVHSPAARSAMINWTFNFSLKARIRILPNIDTTHRWCGLYWCHPREILNCTSPTMTHTLGPRMNALRPVRKTPWIDVAKVRIRKDRVSILNLKYVEWTQLTSLLIQK
jgi:hypothetical protein